MHSKLPSLPNVKNLSKLRRTEFLSPSPKPEDDEKFNHVRKVHFDTNKPHGITFEEDGQTVKAVAKSSQSEDQSIRVGWKAFKLESNGSARSSGFAEFLSTADGECTMLFGVPEEEEKKDEKHCVHVHVRFLLSRLYNCDIPQETFEADLFVEFMWRAPWDLLAWTKYMKSLEEYGGYKMLLKTLEMEDWNKSDLKEFKSPTTRQEEVYYSERVVQSFDRQLNLEYAGVNKFVPTWKPRIIFANMRTKNYDEMNFGDDSYSMVNIGNCWYTVWRRNINNAVFYERYELENFPYDIQELTISVLCTHPKTRVTLVNHKCYRSSCVVLKDNIMLPEWEYLGMRCSVGDDKSGRFSVFNFEAELRRIPDYFIKSGQFIFTSITVVSFLVFGIPAEHDYIGERLSYGSTMLLTTVAFKWLISEKIPNLPYDTYLDDYSQWGFYVQVSIMISNGAMLFVRPRDDDGEIDNGVLQIYDYSCFGVIFFIWMVYQIYAYFIRVPRIIQEERKRLVGMTEALYEKVDKRTLDKMTGRRKTRLSRRMSRHSKRPGSMRIASNSSSPTKSFMSWRSEREESEASEENQKVDYNAVYSVPDRSDESSY